MHQIWVITNKDGEIQHCWEAPDPSDPENPDTPPIEIPDMPGDWKRLKISEPPDFKELKRLAKEKKRLISLHILNEYSVDLKAKKLKKKKPKV